MSEANPKAFTIEPPETPTEYPAAQTRTPSTLIVVTWSLSAAFGVAFWMFVLFYGIPTSLHRILGIIHLIQQHYPALCTPQRIC
jgi:hypothetical protein